MEKHKHTKKNVNRTFAKRDKKKNPDIELEYWEEIEITDPVTREKVLQKVKIIRYKMPSKSFTSKTVSEELGIEEDLTTFWVDGDSSEGDSDE